MTDERCATARAILKDAPLDTSILYTSKPEQRLWDAITHYAWCPACRPMGLATICNNEMRCEEAVQVAIAGKDLLFTVGNATCRTLKDVMAHEHIYGVTVIKEGTDGKQIFCLPKQVAEGTVDPGIDTHPCPCQVCSQVRHIWMSALLHAAYDDGDEAAHGVEWTLGFAEKEGWNIRPLLEAAPPDKLGRFRALLPV